MSDQKIEQIVFFTIWKLVGKRNDIFSPSTENYYLFLCSTQEKYIKDKYESEGFDDIRNELILAKMIVYDLFKNTQDTIERVNEFIQRKARNYLNVHKTRLTKDNDICYPKTDSANISFTHKELLKKTESDNPVFIREYRHSETPIIAEVSFVEEEFLDKIKKFLSENYMDGFKFSVLSGDTQIMQTKIGGSRNYFKDTNLFIEYKKREKEKKKVDIDKILEMMDSSNITNLKRREKKILKKNYKNK